MQVNLWQMLEGLLAPFALAVEALAVAQSEWWRRIAETVQDMQDYIVKALTLSSRRMGRLTVVSIHANRMRALRELREKRKFAEILARSNNIGKGMEALYRDLHKAFGVIIVGAILITLYLVVSLSLGIPQDFQTTGGWRLILLVVAFLLAPGIIILTMLIFYQSCWVRGWWIVWLLLFVGIIACVIFVLSFKFSLRHFIICGLSLGDFILYWFSLTQFYIGAITWRLHYLKRDADKLHNEIKLRLQSMPSIFS